MGPINLHSLSPSTRALLVNYIRLTPRLSWIYHLIWTVKRFCWVRYKSTLGSKPTLDARGRIHTQFWAWLNAEFTTFRVLVLRCVVFDSDSERVVVISAKNHKRQRRKRQSVTAKREVANAKGLNRNTNLA